MKLFKCALITGATSGLGKALVDFLAEKKIEIIHTGRTSRTLPIDLANPTERKKLLEIISDKTPDLIINNAGFGLYGPTVKLSIEEQLQMIEVNINALVEISIHAAKQLIQKKKKGTILNISSTGAFFVFPTFNIYCASKAFVKSFSQALDAEIREYGIRVLCACPGQIATNFRKRAAKNYPQTPDLMTIDVQKAVKYLWKQIIKEKRLYIFDWKMRILVWISYFIPRIFLEKMLKKKLSPRFSSSQDT